MTDVACFIRRLEACRSLPDLERLHDYIRRHIPASAREEYIFLLDNREMQLREISDREKTYL